MFEFEEFNWFEEEIVNCVSIFVKITTYSYVSYINDSYLVDPASSHMLVSKIKPCMSKHKPLHGEAANGSLEQP